MATYFLFQIGQAILEDFFVRWRIGKWSNWWLPLFIRWNHDHCNGFRLLRCCNFFVRWIVFVEAFVLQPSEVDKTQLHIRQSYNEHGSNCHVKGEIEKVKSLRCAENISNY